MDNLPTSTNGTGDLKNSVLKLVREAKRMKLDGVLDPDGLISGETRSHLPILSQALNSYSLPLSKYLHAKGYELFGKTDSRFLEVVYKMLRDEFNYRPKITRLQFLTDSSFIERKILFTFDLLKLCQSKHRDLQRFAVKVGKPVNKPKAIDKVTRPIRMQTVKPVQQDANTFAFSDIPQDDVFTLKPEQIVPTDRLSKASANSSLVPLFQHNIPVPSQLLPQLKESKPETPTVESHTNEFLPSPTPRPASFPSIDFLHDRELDVTPLQTPEKPSRTKTAPTREELKEGVRRIRFQLDTIPDLLPEDSDSDGPIDDNLIELATEDPIPPSSDKITISTSTTGLMFDSPSPEPVIHKNKHEKQMTNLVEQMSARLALFETRLKHVECTPIQTSPPLQVSNTSLIPPSTSPPMTSSRIYNPKKYSENDNIPKVIAKKHNGKTITSKFRSSSTSTPASLPQAGNQFSPPHRTKSSSFEVETNRTPSFIPRLEASSLSSLPDSISTEFSHLQTSPPTHENEVLTVMYNLRKRAERARDMLESANSSRKRLRYKC
ncbi:hypothetical protein LOD99_4537 [Oopsacas minuta]|uniref:Centrosomal protein of 44 kDa n=1 Tax=Oopsacas minuta TaxID=111878 RepID=A0AAV7JSN4_9METZ|nr:hypothetical protein LOD99_4537 [Oopsacas minuta]